MKRALVTVVVAGLVFVGCASSKRSLVAKATATDNYYTAIYEHRCVGTGNPPPDCKRCRDVINDAAWKIKVANQNSQLGYLPPQQAYELEQVVADLETCHQ